jgi:hypothetical protein
MAGIMNPPLRQYKTNPAAIADSAGLAANLPLSSS